MVGVIVELYNLLKVNQLDEISGQTYIFVFQKCSQLDMQLHHHNVHNGGLLFFLFEMDYIVLR